LPEGTRGFAGGDELLRMQVSRAKEIVRRLRSNRRCALCG
jgi:hypothetical protein